MHAVWHPTPRSAEVGFGGGNCGSHDSSPTQLYHREQLSYPRALSRRSADPNVQLTILHLRVVITGNEVTLFDSVLSSGSGLQGAFIWHLEHALKSTGKVAHGLPYEFRALESCLISIITALEMELVNIRGLVLELLQELEDHIGQSRRTSRVLAR